MKAQPLAMKAQPLVTVENIGRIGSLNSSLITAWRVARPDIVPGLIRGS